VYQYRDRSRTTHHAVSIPFLKPPLEGEEPMFIDRRTFRIRPGRMPEMIELAKAQIEPFLELRKGAGSLRYLVNKVATFDTFVFESEWNSLAEWEAYWEEWRSRPETAEFGRKLAELLESGGEHQLWTVVE
jgi:quinol monooxygenase YgiN